MKKGSSKDNRNLVAFIDGILAANIAKMDCLWTALEWREAMENLTIRRQLTYPIHMADYLDKQVTSSNPFGRDGEKREQKGFEKAGREKEMQER